MRFLKKIHYAEHPQYFLDCSQSFEITVPSGKKQFFAFKKLLREQFLRCLGFNTEINKENDTISGVVFFGYLDSKRFIQRTDPRFGADDTVSLSNLLFTVR